VLASEVDMNRLLVVLIIGLVTLAVFTTVLLLQPKKPPLGAGGTMVAEMLLMQKFTFPAEGSLVINVRNVGPVPIDILRTRFFLNDTEVTASGCPKTLNPSESCDVTLTYSGPPLMIGEAYALRIVTADGTAFSYTVVYGSSS
jgi:hypothetical protein